MEFFNLFSLKTKKSLIETTPFFCTSATNFVSGSLSVIWVPQCLSTIASITFDFCLAYLNYLMKVFNEISSLKFQAKRRNSGSDPNNFLTTILLCFSLVAELCIVFLNFLLNSVNSATTRKHSSRMRTAHISSCLVGGVWLNASWDTPPLGWAWRPPPPWVWAWRSPRPDPSTSPWVWAWRPVMHAGIPTAPMWTESQTPLKT